MVSATKAWTKWSVPMGVPQDTVTGEGSAAVAAEHAVSTLEGGKGGIAKAVGDMAEAVNESRTDDRRGERRAIDSRLARGKRESKGGSAAVRDSTSTGGRRRWRSGGNEGREGLLHNIRGAEDVHIICIGNDNATCDRVAPVRDRLLPQV